MDRPDCPLAIISLDIGSHPSEYPYTCQVETLLALPGDRLLAALAALANAHRLRIVAMLAASGRQYVSQLARQVGISRPLLHLHLQKLEAAGLVSSRLELSADGKALNYFEVTKFCIELTPAVIAKAAQSLPDPTSESD
jgi:DNA-binding transcriptional ArsR family regulator